MSHSSHIPYPSDIVSAPIRFSRAWAMPNGSTFGIKPIAEFVQRYLRDSKISIDPFAGNCRWATFTNDLNLSTSADYHFDAEDFMVNMAGKVKADLVLFDPPYSPRQAKECYEGMGLSVGKKETQLAGLHSRVRDAIPAALLPGGIVLSFGWNSCGMGAKHGFELMEVMLVAHGGAHNDTICIAERQVG